MLSKSLPRVRYDHADFTKKVTASVCFSNSSRAMAVYSDT